MKSPAFPKLNQTQMAAFLSIKRVRLSWATREAIVERDADGSYRPEIVTAQWLKYERGRIDKKAGRSEFERQRVRLTRAKAEEVERRLAILDHSLLGTDDIVQGVKTVCLRIKSKLQAALPRLTRACYHAPNLAEALKNSRREFDLLIAELFALEANGEATQFEVVTDASGESAERSAVDKGQGCSAN
jgi:hypothetical protein